MHNELHLLGNEPLKECSRNGANYLRRSLVLGNYIGSPNPPGEPGNIIYDGGGIEDFAFDGSKDVMVQVDRTVVRTFGYQSITGYKDFINTVRINHLIVTGQQDIEHVRDLYVGDPLVSLNSGIKDVSSVNNGYDLGLALQRGSADKNVGFIWDENPPAEATAHEGGEFAFISTTEDGSTKGDVSVEDYLDIRLGNLNVEKDSKSKGSFYLTGENFDITVDNEVHDVEQNVLWDIEGNETHDVEGNLTQNVAGDVTITGDNITLTSNNETHNVGDDYLLNVTDDHTVNVGGDSLLDVEGNSTVDVEGNLTQNVAGDVTITGDNITLNSNDETHNVGDDYLLNVTDDHTVNVGGDSLLDVDGNETHNVLGNLKLDVETNYTVEVGGDETHTVVGDISFDGDNISFETNVFDVHTTEKISLISDKEVIIESHDPLLDLSLNSNKDLILTAVNQVLITGNNGVEITASGDSSITYSGASHLFQVDNADEYDLSSYTEAALQIRNSNTSANQPHALAHFRLDKNGGDGYLGFVAGSSANDQEFVLGEQGDEWLRIDKDGNVGIGTDKPTDYDAEADNFVIKGAEVGVGVTIVSDTAGAGKRGNLYFADGTNGNDQFRGGVTYDHDDDDLSFRTAGSERVWVDSSGNFGIGTAGPRAFANQTSLTINGPQVGRLDLQSNGSNRGNLYGDNTSLTIDTANGIPLHLATAGVDRLTVEAAGDVFVAKKLTVGGDLIVNGTTTTVNSTTLTVDDKNIELAHSPNGQVGDDASINGGGITLKSSASDKTILWDNANDSWQFNQNIEANDGLYVKTDKVRARDAAGLFLQDDGGNGIFVKDGGNVGIGTNDPSGGEVSGKTLEIKDSAASILRLNRVNGQGATIQDFSLYAGSESFAIHDNKDDETRLVIYDGKVGIGVNDPIARLDVHNPYGGDATDKASMSSEAVMKLQPHATNSTNMLFAQVDGGSSMGIQVTNGPATADWDLSLSPFGGNVGIGTTSPAKKLHISEENVAKEAYARIEHTGAMNSVLNLSNDTSDWSIYAMGTAGKDSLRIYEGGPGNGDRVVIDQGGNVGIGTTPNFVAGGGLEIQRAGVASLRLENTANAHSFELQTEESSIIFNDYNGKDFVFTHSNNERMRINGAGNVGINSNDPISVLEVRGRQNWNVSASNLAESVTKSALRVRGSSDSSDSLFFGTSTTSANPYIQATNDAGTNASKNMLLQPWGGNVGINAVSPQARLHVLGDTIIQKDDPNNSEPLIVANYDLANADTQTTAIGFGLARDSNGQKSDAGLITVGKEQQWTNDDSHLDSYMSFSILDGMVSKEKVRIDSDGNVDVKSHNANNKGLKLGGAIVTASAAELNVIDGDTSATATTLAAADRLVVNDNGTMKQVSLTNFETFFESALDDLDNVTSIGKNGTTLTVQGHLTVQGTTTHINSTTVDIDDKNIELGAIANPTDGGANGGGITLKGATDKTIIWDNSNSAWEFNQHVLPSGDNQFNLGKAGQEWKDLYINGTAYLDAINLDGTDLTINATELNQLSTIGNTSISTAQWTYLGNMQAQPLESETSHADVVVDGDFGSQGFMKRGAAAGSYSIVADNSANWNTAHGWGDHASAGYAVDGGDPTPHAHAISDVTNLQAALDGKVDDGQVLTNVPVGAVFTDTHRAIHDTATNGATTTSISSNWAFDNVKTAVPTNAVFTDTQNTYSSSDFNLAGLSDTNIGTPANGEFLKYNGTKWVPASVTTGGGAVSSVANGANNRIATFSSSDALYGETGLTFDGTTFTTAGPGAFGGNLEVGPGVANFAFIDLKNPNNDDYDIRIGQKDGTTNQHTLNITAPAGQDAKLEVGGTGVLTNADSLSDLSDVATTAPAQNQVLTWDTAGGGTWKPAAPQGGTGGGTPAGTDNMIQFNSAGAFNASSGLTYVGSVLKVGAGLGASPADTSIYAEEHIITEGDVIASNTSDINLKENIDRISNPLQKIKRLNGFTFDWKEEYTGYEYFKGKRQVGVSAQDVEEAMPELVTQKSNGSKAVNYDQMIPLLIEGMKEQQKQIADLEAKLNKKK